MKILSLLGGLIALAMVVSADVTVMNNLTSQYKTQQKGKLASRYQGCTSKNVAVRREWGAMSKKERLAYVDAVLCLQSKPSKIPLSLVPGARNRFDNFQAVHINQTFLIHFNARFLPWHRYFVWAYENALRDECGYQGYQPYWDWPRYSDDQLNSPVFDGSAYSLSGNGAYVPHDNFTYIIPRTNLSITIPAGTGGGCIQTGPFVNMSVNLGPVNSAGSLPGYIGSGNGLDYNPRCLTRDFNTAWSRDGLNYERVTDTILQSVNYATLNSNLGRDGVHPSGHFTIGGMQDDLFESPADPAFYLHHAQLDRIWAIWQSLDPAERQNQLQGSTIWWNSPPGPNITLAEPIDLWFEGESREAGTLMSTVDGPFCYLYE